MKLMPSLLCTSGVIAGIAPLPAPKVPLPGHGDSDNPPAEYLAIEEE